MRARESGWCLREEIDICVLVRVPRLPEHSHSRNSPPWTRTPAQSSRKMHTAKHLKNCTNSTLTKDFNVYKKRMVETNTHWIYRKCMIGWLIGQRLRQMTKKKICKQKTYNKIISVLVESNTIIKTFNLSSQSTRYCV